MWYFELSCMLILKQSKFFWVVSPCLQTFWFTFCNRTWPNSLFLPRSFPHTRACEHMRFDPGEPTPPDLQKPLPQRQNRSPEALLHRDLESSVTSDHCGFFFFLLLSVCWDACGDHWSRSHRPVHSSEHLWGAPLSCQPADHRGLRRPFHTSDHQWWSCWFLAALPPRQWERAGKVWPFCVTLPHLSNL